MPLGAAANTRSTALAAGALALLATCAPKERVGFQPAEDAVPLAPPCSRIAPPMPFVQVGADVTLRALCHADAQSEVASVEELGAGVTAWSASIQSATPDAFSLGGDPTHSFETCRTNGISKLTVIFTPSSDARPGDAFDAFVTLHADDGSFPGAAAKVHGEVVAPLVQTDATTVDFGDLLPGAVAQQSLVFFVVNDTGSSLNGAYVDSPFSLRMLPPSANQPHVSAWVAGFTSSVPGDYSASVPFSTSHNPALPTACEWSKTISLHARVLADGGVPDAAD